jgi:hypothetical protein
VEPSSPLTVLELAVSSLVFCQVIGIPLAWLKIRKTEEWKSRPRDEFAITVLNRFIGVYLILAALYGGVVGFAMWIGTKVA